MAKRPLLDSTRQARANTTTRTLSPEKFPLCALSLGLLLILSSLISFNCASLETRQQHSKSRAHGSSDNTISDSLIGQWAPSPALHIGYKPFAQVEQAPASIYEIPDRQQQSSSSSPWKQPAIGSYSNDFNNDLSLADDRQKFYGQLQLLANSNDNNYNYYDSQNNNENLIIRPASELNGGQFTEIGAGFGQSQYQLATDSTDDNNLARQLASLSFANSGEYSPLQTTSDADEDRRRLLQLLGPQNSEPIVGRNQLSEDYQLSFPYLLEPNSKQLLSIYQTLDNQPVPSKASDGDEISSSSAAAAPADLATKRDLDEDKKFAYQVEGATTQASVDEAQKKRSELKQQDSSKSTLAASGETRPNITVTTLLDDDDNLDDDQSKKDTTPQASGLASSETSVDDKTAKANATASSLSTEQVSYGRIVTKESDKVHTEASSEALGLSRIGSLLSGLYNLVANSWPASLSKASSGANSTAAQLVNDEQSSSVSRSEKEPIAQEVKAAKKTITKLSVSESNLDDEVDLSNNNNRATSKEDTSEERNKWKSSLERENNDKQPKVSQVSKIETEKTSTSEDYDVSESSKRAIRIITKPKAKAKAVNQEEEASSFESEIEGESGSKQLGDHNKISHLRQSSNLVTPLKSSDELLVESTSSSSLSAAAAGKPSLFGKYIYAPEHHYHLSTASGFVDTKRFVADDISNGGGDHDDDDDDGGGQMFAAAGLAQRGSTLRNIHAGDDVYAAGPFSRLRPFFAQPDDERRATDRLSMLPNNKSTNDLYFLVMVAAFCAMAMAVVLAAGLFAYRVQQNRKSTSEADYPTYGVVGPNNMSGLGGGGGKNNGAASFVGGYFATGPGSSSSGSKSGSVKQLADMYSIGADSGISAGAPGTGKSGGKRGILAGEQVLSAPGINNNSGANNNGSQNRFANQNAARMFHYQHQKQQMIISDRSSNGRHTSTSDLDSEDENDENNYTVYECPGLASAHEMEIKNPLFNDDQTP